MGGGGQKERTKQVSTAQYQSADLFDIVKGQLLDEGMSEEEIKDIMLTLTPDEIMKELSAEEYKQFDPKKPDPKQVAAQAQQEKNKQKSSDPMGVKNTNIGGRGKDLG